MSTGGDSGTSDGFGSPRKVTLAVSAALTGAIGTTSSGLTIGSWGGGEYFKGTIDDVAVYSSVLSAAKVANHYALGTGSASITGSLASFVVTRPAVGATFNCSIHGLTSNLLSSGPTVAPIAHGDEDDHPVATTSGGPSTTAVAAVSRSVPPGSFTGAAGASPRRNSGIRASGKAGRNRLGRSVKGRVARPRQSRA